MSHRAKVRSEDKRQKEYVELQYMHTWDNNHAPARLGCCRDSREGAILPTAASGGINISTCPLCDSHVLFSYSIYYDATAFTRGGKCPSRPSTVPNTPKTSTIRTYHKQNCAPSKAPLNSNIAILLHVIHHV